MGKITKILDSFTILICGILVGLGLIYNYSDKYLAYFVENSKLQLVYENKLAEIKLQKQIRHIQKTSGKNMRSPASIELSVEEQIQNLLENNSDTKGMAEKLYLETVVFCKESIHLSKCADHLNTMITHFPESKWAAEALLVLVEVYIKDKSTTKATELIELIKVEFSKNQHVIKRAGELERAAL